MRLLLTSCLALALLGSSGAAQAPAPESAPFTPSARLLYESDARAYYRPCG